MTGAMYAAVSGLRTHMSALNVIGQNISNVNTNAYKATRYTFAEALYTSVHSGSNGTEVLGGRNPAQIGYGCSIATVDLDMSTKNYTPTGQLMDVMIDGDGFLLVGDKTKKAVGINDPQSELQAMNLTRHGDLTFVDGYLVDGQGQVVYGFLTNPDNEAVPVLTPIRLPRVKKDANGNYQYYGYKYYNDKNAVDIDYTKPIGAAENAGNATAASDTDTSWVTLQNLTIEENGRIVGTSGDRQFIVGYVALAQVDNPNGVTHVDGRYYQAMGGAGEVHLVTAGASVTCAKGEGTDYAAAKPAEGEGAGATAATAGNGPIQIDGAGKTTFINGGLESSGTDLATEISNMIIIQRGYQANTRIVTVTDSMLEELVNMKRG